MVKVLLLFYMFCNCLLYSKEVNVNLEHPFYKNKLYEGNIENGKMNGFGIIYDIEKNKKTKFLEGNFKDDNIVNGSFFTTDKFRDEIKFGIIQKQENEKGFDPAILRTIYGNFNKPKDLKSFITILHNNLNVKVDFYNTQSYDNIQGKLYILDDDLYINGTLTLFNNKIKKVKAIFDFKSLEFYKGSITIETNEFIIEGFVSNGSDLNNFTLEGVIKWNEGLEYYVTNYKFKDNWFDKIDNLKKLASPIKNNKPIKETNKIVKENIKEIKVETLKKEIKIDTSDIKYKNKELYGNDNSKLNLEN